MARPEPADLIWAALISAALGSDVVLIRRDLTPLTIRARRPVLVVFWVLFGGHLAGAWGRFDPFQLLGKYVTPRRLP